MSKLFTFSFIDPFDCSDICHLAWLVRDQPGLMDNIFKLFPPTCSNGTSFFYLDPLGFSDCEYDIQYKGLEISLSIT